MFYIRRYQLFLVIASCIVFIFYYAADYSRLKYPVSYPEPAAPPQIPVSFSKLPENFPVTSFKPLPTVVPAKLPVIQYSFDDETPTENIRRGQRTKAVRENFKHAWEGYKTYAWLKDEVTPISGQHMSTFNGWAATLVDTLDTLWIMGLHQEFEEAVKAVESIDFTMSANSMVNVFETTIRYLGGLLGAYDISGGKYPSLVQKASDIGEILYAAFDTPNRMPVTRWELLAYVRGDRQTAAATTLVAELGSLTLEFTRLSQLTGNPKYYDAVERISDLFEAQQNSTKLPGMWPVVVNAAAGSLTADGYFTLGGMSDSVYEYLPKQHMILGGAVDRYRKMYEAAIKTVTKNLLFRPMTKNNEDVLISGNVRVSEAEGVQLITEGQHLTCFIGGVIGISAKIFNRPDDLVTARKLVDGCIWAYESMPTGIMPEIFQAVPCESKGSCEWNEQTWYRAITKGQYRGGLLDPDQSDERAKELIKEKRLVPGMTDFKDKRYILRPEAIESIYILYRITGDEKLREKAWKMFEAIERHTRTSIGHAGISDVTNVDSPKQDRMESFWLAETLKYFYLIFSKPDLASLDDYVLNTEAHFLKRVF